MRYFRVAAPSFLLLPIAFVVSCSNEPKDRSSDQSMEILGKLSSELTNAEINDNVESFISFYDVDALSMPEFQPTIEGTEDIRKYYEEMFKKQYVKSFVRSNQEYIVIDSIVLEIGTFEKSLSAPSVDSLVVQRGKYFFVWQRKGNTFKLKCESSGFFHQVDHPEWFFVDGLHSPKADDEGAVPLELRALNTLMAKYVSEGSGALRAGFFTDDGKFFPFAHEPVSGMDEIKPYLIKYDNHGPDFKMDTISVYTLHYEYHGEYVLEYPQFFVRWSAPGISGGAEGKGIRLWKRQQDHSLRLYREIGTHNYLID